MIVWTKYIVTSHAGRAEVSVYAVRLELDTIGATTCDVTRRVTSGFRRGRNVSAEREISLAAGLQDPHIVPVLSAGVAAGLPCYTMPFVDGESLRARLTAVGPQRLPVVDAVTILRDVAAALEYAHGRGVVHRDIKPENVLLAGRMAVVTDFGIAKAVSAPATVAGKPGGTLTHAGVSLGNPAYMAPEQVAGDEVDQRADIYAWGVMAYEVLAGAHCRARAHPWWSHVRRPSAPSLFFRSATWVVARRMSISRKG